MRYSVKMHKVRGVHKNTATSLFRTWYAPTRPDSIMIISRRCIMEVACSGSRYYTFVGQEKIKEGPGMCSSSIEKIVHTTAWLYEYAAQQPTYSWEGSDVCSKYKAACGLRCLAALRLKGIKTHIQRAVIGGPKIVRSEQAEVGPRPNIRECVDPDSSNSESVTHCTTIFYFPFVALSLFLRPILGPLL
jgi:hypothetical protein